MTMLLFAKVITVIFVAVTVALSLAHALELPGKMRLDKPTYLAVQRIYYPGFTYGGVCEGLGMIATPVLLLMLPARSPSWWLTLAALVALVAAHAVYWIVTHPVNKLWLKDEKLEGFGGRFFAVGSSSAPEANDGEDAWRRARDTWERSHVIRAILVGLAFIALVVAIAL